MKKIYEAPDMEVLKCVIEDVILASIESTLPVQGETSATLPGGDEIDDGVFV